MGGDARESRARRGKHKMNLIEKASRVYRESGKILARSGRMVCCLGMILASGTGLLRAEEEAVAENRGIRRHGFTYNIAEDRKVEKVGGLYEPEGLDKYMKRHMDALEARMAGLESEIEELKSKLDETIVILKESGSKNS